MTTEAEKTRVTVTVREMYMTRGRVARYHWAKLSCGCTARITAAVLPMVGDVRTCRQCTNRARGR